ncbi:MAG: 6,7-dimethyl-8-ribityllumazine synthase [Pseudomonadota bacterium]
MAGHSDNDMGLPSFEKPVKGLIAIAPYYTKIAEQQVAAVESIFKEVGAELETVEVPGSLEVPTAIAMAHRMSNYDCYVALGCVIRGRTSHYDVVVEQSSNGIMLLGLQGLCVGNGIITVENMEQAEERADVKRLNTAGAAAEAALHLLALQRKWGAPKGGIGFKPTDATKIA